MAVSAEVMRLPGGVLPCTVSALEVGYKTHSASVAFRLAKRKRCQRLLPAEAKETMRIIDARLDDVLRLAIGKFDRLRLSESRLGGGLEGVCTGLPSEAKLAVPGRLNGE